MKLSPALPPALLGGSKILAQAMPILLLGWFSQRLPTSALGLLAFLTASISILAWISDFGLSDGMNRFAGEKPKAIAPVILWEFVLATAVGLGCWALDLATGFFSGHGVPIALATLASSFYVIVASWSGRLRLGTAATMHAGSALAFGVGAILLFRSGWDAPSSLLWARTGSWLLFDVVLLLLLARERLLRFDFHLNPEIRIFALHLVAFSAAELLLSQTDVFWVRRLLGDLAAAEYKPAALLAAAPMALGTLVSAPLLPILRRLWRSEPARARRIALLVSGGSALLLGAVCLAGLPIARPLLAWFYQPEIAEKGAPVFRWILLATSFYVAGMPLQEYLLASDRSRWIGGLALGRAAVFLGLALPALRLGGITGMAALLCALYGITALLLLSLSLRLPPPRTP